MKRLSVLLAVVALLSASCGAADPVAQDNADIEVRPSTQNPNSESLRSSVAFAFRGDERAALTSCPGGIPGLDFMSFVGYLGNPRQAVLRVSGNDLQSISPRPEQVVSVWRDQPSYDVYRIDPNELGVELVAGAIPEEFTIEVALWDRLVSAGAGRTILLDVNLSGWVAGVTPIQDPTGAVVLANDCAGFYDSAFQSALASLEIAPEVHGFDVLADLYKDTDGVRGRLLEQTEAPQRPEWLAQDPDLRIIDPEETPQSVLDTLEQVFVTLELGPEVSRLGERTICSKIASVGWNECVRLNASTPDTVKLSASVVIGEPLEIWILNRDADVSNPLQYLGSISTDVVRGAGQPDLPVRITESEDGEVSLAE